MVEDYSLYSKEFLELASEQRIAILLDLEKAKSKVSVLAKKLDATIPEVYRNFERLVNAGIIKKDSDGDYLITRYGKIVCTQLPSIRFMSDNKKYFQEHDFGDLPLKLLQRIGSFVNCRRIKGFVKIMEKWKDLYNNSDEYIVNILHEVPYTSDLMDPLIKKIESGVKLSSIISESAIVPKQRKQILETSGIKKLIDKGMIERRMLESVSVILILNEKEGCIMFPGNSGEVDLAEGFYGTDIEFREWCMDYFDYSWKRSRPFQENKLKHD